MPRKTSRYALDTFLRQLARTGNFALAADLAGLAKSGLYKRRARDPAFAAACAAALDSSPRFRGEGDHVKHGGGALATQLLTTHGSIHRSTYAGRTQLRRLAPGCLSEAGVTAFLARLAATCNVRLSAEQVGVRPSSIHRRRQRDGRFAEAMDQVIAHAAVALECDVLAAVIRALDGDESDEGDDHPPLGFEGRGTAEGGGGASCVLPGQDIGQWPAHPEPVEPQATAGPAHPEEGPGPDPGLSKTRLEGRITGQIGFQDALRLLILHRNAFGTPRTKHDRRRAAHEARYRPRELSDEEVREKLVKRLVAFGKRIKSQEGEG